MNATYRGDERNDAKAGSPAKSRYAGIPSFAVRRSQSIARSDFPMREYAQAMLYEA